MTHFHLEHTRDRWQLRNDRGDLIAATTAIAGPAANTHMESDGPSAAMRWAEGVLGMTSFSVGPENWSEEQGFWLAEPPYRPVVLESDEDLFRGAHARALNAEPGSPEELRALRRAVEVAEGWLSPDL